MTQLQINQGVGGDGNCPIVSDAVDFFAEVIAREVDRIFSGDLGFHSPPTEDEKKKIRTYFVTISNDIWFLGYDDKPLRIIWWEYSVGLEVRVIVRALNSIRLKMIGLAMETG